MHHAKQWNADQFTIISVIFSFYLDRIRYGYHSLWSINYKSQKSLDFLTLNVLSPKYHAYVRCFLAKVKPWDTQLLTRKKCLAQSHATWVHKHNRICVKFVIFMLSIKVCVAQSRVSWGLAVFIFENSGLTWHLTLQLAICQDSDKYFFMCMPFGIVH